jgi:hypothetical protein
MVSSIPSVGEGHTSSNRFSVYEAAEVMGITVDAIRKRVGRGTIPHEKGEDGRVWCYWTPARKRPVMYRTPTSRNLLVMRSYPR